MSAIPHELCSCLTAIDIHATYLASSYVVEDKRIPGPAGDILIRTVVPVAADTARKFPVMLWVAVAASQVVEADSLPAEAAEALAHEVGEAAVEVETEMEVDLGMVATVADVAD